jgi:hypothetical protein
MASASPDKRTLIEQPEECWARARNEDHPISAYFTRMTIEDIVDDHRFLKRKRTEQDLAKLKDFRRRKSP